MTKFPAGTVAWAGDPTKTHPERPVVVLSHDKRPYNSVECTVMCLGTGAEKYDHYTPELTTAHLSGISFSDTTYLMPWALYTIAPGAILTSKPRGSLTDSGENLVKKGLLSLFSV